MLHLHYSEVKLDISKFDQVSSARTKWGGRGVASDWELTYVGSGVIVVISAFQGVIALL